MRKRGRTMYVSQDVDVEIYFDDIRNYVNDYASEDELKILAKDLEKNYLGQRNVEVKTLEDEFKLELLMLAFNKYSLSEIENKLGTKFDLS
jgi:hypothetical protein